MRIRSLLQGKKRYLAAAVVAASLGGGAYAFAASLNVTSNTLASGTSQVTNGTCSGLNASYTTSYSNNAYYLATITVTGKSASCESLNYKLDVAGSGGGSLFETTGTLTASGNGTDTETVTADTVDASLVDNVSAVVESNTAP